MVVLAPVTVVNELLVDPLVDAPELMETAEELVDAVFVLKGVVDDPDEIAVADVVPVVPIMNGCKR